MKLRLVDNWRHAYKWASMQLAAIVAVLVGFIITNPTFLFSPIMFFPDELKLVAALLTAIFVFALVAATRLFKKVKPPTDCKDDTDAPAEPTE